LLFYHLKLRRYIVIELKARPFEVGDGAQLGMYMHAVDELLCQPEDKPTLGLLLVREKNRVLGCVDILQKKMHFSVFQTRKVIDEIFITR